MLVNEDGDDDYQIQQKVHGPIEVVTEGDAIPVKPRYEGEQEKGNTRSIQPKGAMGMVSQNVT